ncbi:MAG: urea carboxylase [Bryobacteraceae bacterium]
MFRKVLVANRGAIACRIIRTLRRMGVGSVAIYSEADRHAAHVPQADEAVCVGPPPAAESYLNAERILEAARSLGVEAVHPGYGFLSENADFAEACAHQGLEFVGPEPDQIRAFGLKHTARKLAREEDLALLPGSGLLENARHARWEADRIGYPVILKSTAGGGGIGMRVCRSAAELEDGLAAVERLGASNFGQPGAYLERYVERARHIEVQIFGSGRGSVVALGERDCSAQRRNQKVIEETPAPGLSELSRRALVDAAVRLAQSVRYRSAGTVEFILDQTTGEFYFLEVNTRLQVEHGVTEEVTGIDLVEWMVKLAAGELPPLELLSTKASGASIQVRLYAEDPAKDFRPSSGTLHRVEYPDGVRWESWVGSGAEVTPYYDPMLAKVIVRAEDREAAVAKLSEALEACRLDGIETNLPYLRQIVSDDRFRAGGMTTAYLKDFPYRLSAAEVIEAGTQTTVQDFPGRLGYWHVGVPPSGPMDHLAFRLVNRIAGNDEGAAAIECAMTGPALRFHADTTIAIGGADMGATLDGNSVPRWRPVEVKAGQTLHMGAAASGARSYLAIAGGIDVPCYLGSRSTFILGKFGGHAGRTLRTGDVLRWGTDAGRPWSPPAAAEPKYSSAWEIGVLYGPHGEPDFFTPDDIRMIFSTSWKVHYNSDRTGVRLIGPKPRWARSDGGEAGLHPSNIHDNAYAIGAMDFTGDMPVLLGPDGPSLGGFVCPCTIAHAELWKLGQLKPGDEVRFRLITIREAEAMDRAVDEVIAGTRDSLPSLPIDHKPEAPVVRIAGDVVTRQAGDRNLLIEFGPLELDLALRFRVHALEQSLRNLGRRGILDITPGIRSLQIHFDARRVRREELLELVENALEGGQDPDAIEAPSRTVHLPLSWDDPATRLAIEKYTQSVRPDAPWCPSNIEFIRRINGLGSEDDVRRIVYDANYLVLGLGDVYLGAPVATPVDPRHRLVTTKYNPARTWTAENSVGIGGAYLCVYGMEGPGGYQFIGRTIQMWNTHRATADFPHGKPWLLRFFDQIRFYPVTAAELLELRDAFPHGRFALRTEEGTFRLGDYRRFLSPICAEAGVFKRRQQEAFDQERERWAAAGQAAYVDEPLTAPASGDDDAPPDGCASVRSPITANVWQISVEPGQHVEPGQKLVVLEAMKMEVAVVAPQAGVVEALRCSKGGMVAAGQSLVVFKPDLEAA